MEVTFSSIPLGEMYGKMKMMREKNKMAKQNMTKEENANMKVTRIKSKYGRTNGGRRSEATEIIPDETVSGGFETASREQSLYFRHAAPLELSVLVYSLALGIELKAVEYKQLSF